MMTKNLSPIFGMIMILFGLCLLGYLSLVVYQAITIPEHVPIVNYILERVPSEPRIAFGWFDGKKFDFQITEQTKLIIFLLLAILALNGLVRIAIVVLRAGIKMVEGERVRKSARSFPNSQYSNTQYDDAYTDAEATYARGDETYVRHNTMPRMSGYR